MAPIVQAEPPATSDQARERTESRPLVPPDPPARGRGWWRLMLLLAMVAAAAGATASSAYWLFPKAAVAELTHTVQRGDLVISVTEQGTLESSNNTEIKCKVRGRSTVTWVIPGGSIVQPGDELVRLDTKLMDEAHSLTLTNTHIATATLARTTANVAKAKIAIDAYLQGRYRSQKQTLDRELKIAQRNLQTAETMLKNSETLFERGFVTELEVEANEFSVAQARFEVKVKETEQKVLEQFTKKMELAILEGNLTASQSKLKADQAGLKMEQARQKRAKAELDACVIKADRGGLVIYPSAAAWKNTPDITQGAAVGKDQVLLLMPDLDKMQVKVGVHESIVDRVKPGLRARITLPDRVLEAEVSTVANVTRPAGWWTGNVVKYDTIIKLPKTAGLKPGMSAEVEIFLAVHRDVLFIPVAAVVESDKGAFCWIQTEQGPQRRVITLGDTNDVYLEVERGLEVGDEVILNPLGTVPEAKQMAASSLKGVPRTPADAARTSAGKADAAEADAASQQ